MSLALFQIHPCCCVSHSLLLALTYLIFHSMQLPYFYFPSLPSVKGTEISSNFLPPQTCPFKDLFGNFFRDKYPEAEPLSHRVYKQVLSLLSTMPAPDDTPTNSIPSLYPHTTWRYPAFWYLPFSLVWHDISLLFEHFSTRFLIFCVSSSIICLLLPLPICLLRLLIFLLTNLLDNSSLVLDVANSLPISHLFCHLYPW